MTTMLPGRGRDIMVPTLCGLAGLVLTAGTLLATPRHAATDSPRESTLNCRWLTPGLEAPCRQLVEVNPPAI